MIGFMYILIAILMCTSLATCVVLLGLSLYNFHKVSKDMDRIAKEVRATRDKLRKYL